MKKKLLLLTLVTAHNCYSAAAAAEDPGATTDSQPMALPSWTAKNVGVLFFDPSEKQVALKKRGENTYAVHNLETGECIDTITIEGETPGQLDPNLSKRVSFQNGSLLIRPRTDTAERIMGAQGHLAIIDQEAICQLGHPGKQLKLKIVQTHPTKGTTPRVVFSPDGKICAIHCASHTVDNPDPAWNFYHFQHNDAERLGECQAASVFFTADSSRVIAMLAEGGCLIHDIKKSGVFPKVKIPGFSLIKITPNPHLIALSKGVETHHWQYHTVITGAPVGEPFAETLDVIFPAVSTGVMATRDPLATTIQLCDFKTRKPLAEPFTFAWPTTCQFSPDGKYLEMRTGNDVSFANISALCALAGASTRSIE